MTSANPNAGRLSPDDLRRMHAAARLLLVPMLALAACSTAHVSSDYDHSAQFSSFHSFTLMMRQHPSAKNPLVVQRTYDAIRAELTRKGFVYVADPAQADFAVDFTIGASDRLDVRSSPGMAYGGPWLGAGWCCKELSQSDLEHTQTLIGEAVSAVLADFPPKVT